MKDTGEAETKMTGQVSLLLEDPWAGKTHRGEPGCSAALLPERSRLDPHTASTLPLT